MSGPLISEWHGTPLITTRYIDNLMKFYQGSTLDPLYINWLISWTIKFDQFDRSQNEQRN
jgi:hypothetical protein